jgi:hypothetical protein
MPCPPECSSSSAGTTRAADSEQNQSHAPGVHLVDLLGPRADDRLRQSFDLRVLALLELDARHPDRAQVVGGSSRR